MDCKVGAGATMMMLKALVAFCTGVPAPVTCTVKLYVPTVEGVPVIAPVLAFRVNPGGKPLAIDQV